MCFCHRAVHNFALRFNKCFAEGQRAYRSLCFFVLWMQLVVTHLPALLRHCNLANPSGAFLKADVEFSFLDMEQPFEVRRV